MIPEISAKQPVVIVPVFARDTASAQAQAAAAQSCTAAEWVELRLDSLPRADYAAALSAVRAAVQKPLIVTLRTAREGGKADLTPNAYAEACRALLAQGGVDVLDVEWSVGAALADELRRAAHAAGAAALFSKHCFDGTPATDEMVSALNAMLAAGADIAKLAVMPQSAADAARLLLATAQVYDAHPDARLITMSMGKIGAVTRFCGGAFGSAATFGALSAASAPGQPAAALLHERRFVSD